MIYTIGHKASYDAGLKIEPPGTFQKLGRDQAITQSWPVQTHMWPVTEPAWLGGPSIVFGERSLTTGEIVATMCGPGGPGGTGDCREIVVGHINVSE